MNTTEQQPITSEQVTAWMREQLAKAHELSNYAHIQVHLNANKAYPNEDVRVSIYCGEGFRTGEHATIEGCFNELATTERKSPAQILLDKAEALIARAKELETQAATL